MTTDVNTCHMCVQKLLNKQIQNVPGNVVLKKHEPKACPTAQNCTKVHRLLSNSVVIMQSPRGTSKGAEMFTLELNSHEMRSV